jgi:UTP:GlnB (protein PII) uridylyltransferase
MTRQIEHDLRASIFGHSRITPIREAASQLFSARRYESFIEIDNEVSNTFTILELHFPDRLGLLYDIMTMLYALEVDIDAAVINTDEDMAEDIFYVHRHGNKLTAEHLWNLLGSVWDVAVGKLSSGQTT